MAADGSFLVVWRSAERNLADTANRDKVRSQAFDANANPVGSEQLLSTLGPETTIDIGVETAPLRVADGSAGGFVVVWSSNSVVRG